MHVNFYNEKTGAKPTSMNRNKIVYFKVILSLVEVDSNKIGFSWPVACKGHWVFCNFQVSKERKHLLFWA